MNNSDRNFRDYKGKNYVYVFSFNTLNKCKIGVSNDPFDRLEKLGMRKYINWGKSFKAKCSDGDAYKVEGFLHLACSEYRAKAPRMALSGVTEFFKIQARDVAFNALTEHKNILKVEYISPLDYKEPIKRKDHRRIARLLARLKRWERKYSILRNNDETRRYKYVPV